MTCSVGSKGFVRGGLALAVLAIAFMGPQTARATDPTDSPDIVTAPQAPIGSRDLVAVRRDPGDPGDAQAERPLRADGASGQDAAKLERTALRNRRVRREEDRVRRDEDRPQPRLRREAQAAPWHRSGGGGGIGLILGVGF
jgi:hypothetical protein